MIRYLENRFVEIARTCKRYTVLTKNTYRNTVMKESQIAVMEKFVDNVQTLISALGYKVLEPLNKSVTVINESGDNPDTEDCVDGLMNLFVKLVEVYESMLTSSYKEMV